MFCASSGTSISIVPILLGTTDSRRDQWRTIEMRNDPALVINFVLGILSGIT